MTDKFDDPVSFNYKVITELYNRLSSEVYTPLASAGTTDGTLMQAVKAAIDKYIQSEHNIEVYSLKPSNCTYEGEEKKKCSKCGKYDSTNTIPTNSNAHIYNYSEQSPTWSWTLSQDGSEYTAATAIYPCIYNSAHSKSMIGADITSEQTKTPNCINTGIQTYTADDGYHSSQREIELPINTEINGHNYSTIDYDATCTKGGYTLYTCTRCNYSVPNHEYEDIDKNKPALGHESDGVLRYIIIPTCTSTGTRGYRCVRFDNCGEYLNVEIVPMQPHEEKIEIAYQAPTCIEKGHTAKIICNVCKKVLQESTDIDMIDHNSDKVISAVDPTCTEVGYTQELRCSMCDKVMVAKEEVSALGHDWIEVPQLGTYVAPTCETTGIMPYKCSCCDASKTEEISALGHNYTSSSWGDWNISSASNANIELYLTGCTNGTAHKEDNSYYCDIDNGRVTSSFVSAATCTVKAKYSFTATVSSGDAWGTEYSTSTEAEVGDYAAHTSVNVAAVPATCSSTGATAGTKCSICNTILSGCEEIPKLDHTWTISWEWENYDERGTVPIVATCKICEYSEENSINCTRDNITYQHNGDYSYQGSAHYIIEHNIRGNTSGKYLDSNGNAFVSTKDSFTYGPISCIDDGHCSYDEYENMYYCGLCNQYFNVE